MAFESPDVVNSGAEQASRKSGLFGILERITMGPPAVNSPIEPKESVNQHITNNLQISPEKNEMQGIRFEPIELIDFGRAAGSVSLNFNKGRSVTLSYNGHGETQFLDSQSPAVDLSNLPPNMHFVVTADEELSGMSERPKIEIKKGDGHKMLLMMSNPESLLSPDGIEEDIKASKQISAMGGALGSAVEPVGQAPELPM